MNFEQAIESGPIMYTCKGVSMLPLIKQGEDAVVIEKASDYKRLDIVLFKRPNGSYVLHRILRKKGEEYYICGDNCAYGEYVPHEWIIGKMTALVRNGEKITDFAYNPWPHRTRLKVSMIKNKIINKLHR